MLKSNLFDMEQMLYYFVFSRLDFGNCELIAEKCSRTDLMFYKNNGGKILYTLAESLGLPNTTAETIDV